MLILSYARRWIKYQLVIGYKEAGTRVSICFWSSGAFLCRFLGFLKIISGIIYHFLYYA